MKKIIALSLAVATIIICCWHFTEQLNNLDIVATKNDEYALFRKREITKRNDLNKCQKEILKNSIDAERTKQKQVSKIASNTQFVVIGIVFIQLILCVVLFFPKRYISPKLIS